MRKYFLLLSIAVAVLTGCNSDSYDDTAVWEKINSLDSRVTALENTLTRMNTDINAISVLVNTQKSNVYITSVQETYIGYLITFSDNRTITIRHGENGKDGADGKDGVDGKDGANGKDGVDGVDGVDGKDGVNGKDGVDGKDGKDGVNGKDGVDGKDGLTPYIGANGNWWIGTTDTRVSARGTDGKDGKDGKDGLNGKDGFTPYIGANGNWWIDNEDIGVAATGTNGKDGKDGKDGTNGADGLTPYIGINGNWWTGTEDSGISALGIKGQDGKTPYIGSNGNWWIGDTDTGVAAAGSNGSDGQDYSGTTETPMISISLYEGHYYWVQIINNVKTFILNPNGEKIPVDGTGGVRPIIRVDTDNYWRISFDGGITFIYIQDSDGNPYKASSNCECKSLFQNVYMYNNYLIVILADGTVLPFYVGNGIAEAYPITGIPYEYHRNPYLHNPNTTIPAGASFSFGRINGATAGRIFLPGVPKPKASDGSDAGWVDLIGTDQTGHNLWLEIDDEPRGNIVEEANEENTIETDIVFIVDNSGSMSEEADAVARDIIAWAQTLTSAGLDVRFACVGYSVSGRVNGAIDFTTSAGLSTYLNRSSGTNRTVGFASTQLSNAASSYSVSDECGGMALRYADANLTFRSDANRIYVNFTDEPNQPNGNAAYSVYYFQNASNWPPSKGTVYTVYSGYTTYNWSNYYAEQPWLISEFTGGTTFYTDGSFSGVTLSQLPVTGAVTHSHAIYFTDIDDKFDGNDHKIKITVFEPDGSIQAEREWQVTFGR